MEEYGALKVEIGLLKAETENHPMMRPTRHETAKNPDIDLFGAYIKWILLIKK